MKLTKTQANFRRQMREVEKAQNSKPNKSAVFPYAGTFLAFLVFWPVLAFLPQNRR
jgi:hypothetical protein